MIGAGKYDAICTAVREETEAQAVLLIVINGLKGSGFTCQASSEVVAKVPDMLEDMARQIRADIRRGSN